MTISANVLQDEHLLYVRCSGFITAADVDAYYLLLQACDGIDSCTKALIDLLTDKPDVSQVPIKNLSNLSLHFKQCPLLPKDAKMAVVVSTKLSFAFTRLFIANRGEYVTIKAFMDMGKALAWLELDEPNLAKACALK
ncbi:MAG: hypothetical protein AUK35_01810 [Zetaproteobacteria bacterium CG2_30_46_52]|nr:MAG: hypothetical protein AUK35_01810 [Zetaproteobacteria bacterium CG2_30_46_52]